MNLQISVPHQKCVYSCPMCVARAHRNEGTFENLYKTNKMMWYKKLHEVIYSGEYNSIVITGECDPTQDMAYCEDVISVIDDHNPTPTVEFTTHNQKAVRTLLASYWGKKVDVVSLSVTNVREYLNAWRFPERNAFFSPIYRMVILLTEEFEFLNVNNFNTMGFDQITFKTLQHGEDADVNAWIDSNKMSEEGLAEIRKIVDKYNSHETCSVRLDTSCQDATNRYEIFRSDGEVYDSWEAIPKYGEAAAVEKLRADLKSYSEEDLETIKKVIADCAEEESVVAYDKQGFPIKEISFSKKPGEYSTDNATVRLDNISYPPERFVYKDIPAPIIKEAKETDYE